MPTTNNDVVAIENSSGQLEISSSVVNTNAYGIYRGWGLDKDGSGVPEFISGYANATTMEFDLVDLGAGANTEIDFYAGLTDEDFTVPATQNLFEPSIQFDSVYSNFKTRYSAKFNYTTVSGSGVSTQFLLNTSWTNTGDTSSLHGTYKIELYDMVVATGSICTFEFKVSKDGVVLFESLTSGGSRNSDPLAFRQTNNEWCSYPRIGFINARFTDQATTTIDNVKLHVNADDSCVP